MVRPGMQSLESQLLNARKRLQWGQGHIEGAVFDVTLRIDELQAALQSLKQSKDLELLRHFPVAAIAILETHFKATVREIVDSGPTYVERGILLTKDRLKSLSDVLPLIHRQTVTIGELVAHQLPFNSIASYEDALGNLLDLKLKNSLATVRDPSDVRNGLDSPPLISNIGDLWRTLAETFERRHILAHEAATRYVVTWEDASAALECVSALTVAMDAVLWGTIWATKPLSQMEINADALTQYAHSYKDFCILLRKAFAVAKRCGEYELFKQRQIAWRRHAIGWARMIAGGFENGSLKPLIIATTRKQLLEARKQEIEVWLNWWQPESFDF